MYNERVDGLHRSIQQTERAFAHALLRVRIGLVVIAVAAIAWIVAIWRAG